LRSAPAVTVVCSSGVLCLYCHWICSTDIAVCFASLMFKSKQNESPYGNSVTDTERLSTKRTIAWKLLVKNCLSELHENPTDGSVVDVTWQTDWRPDVFCT